MSPTGTGRSCPASHSVMNGVSSGASRVETAVMVTEAVRDVSALAELDLGVKALGSSPRKSAKTGAGERDVVVSFGGATFTPGAQLVSDEDGVVVLPV